MTKAPKLECDLVMRGGITSGIVYPRAIAKLAETYNFRSIGGTSAGAIAAAVTAAAQLGVRKGKDRFQTLIKDLPARLATKKLRKTELERLFQPQTSTRRLFRVLMAGLGRENTLGKLLKISAALCGGYLPFALAGAAVFLGPLFAAAWACGLEGWTLGALIASVAIPLTLCSVLGAAIGAGLDVIWRVPKNGYGLCSGSSGGKPDEAGVLPLTDWLHELIQEAAGRAAGGKPVTFGDLWNNRGDVTAERDIELVLMTSNVTRGISQRFPFLEGSWGQLFFNEAKFGELFPKPIVDWMKKRAQKPRHEDVVVPAGYRALPRPGDLPILVGARMSLSFPFLLSAVPLYAGDVTNKSADGKIPLERCWFSDGGLTSNFPLHFFDAPLPMRPTFGINLVPATVDIAETDDHGQSLSALKPQSGQTGDQNPWRYIYMPSTNATGIVSAARFNKFEGEKGSIVEFFSALFDTARNWGDTELMAMPGYRDRIVHVGLGADEGGLNLSMPDQVIAAVGARGEKAGELLAGRFAPTPTAKDRLTDPQSGDQVQLTWDNQRWIRYRSLMAALEVVVQRLRRSWQDSERPEATWWRSYAELLARGAKDLPSSYRIRNLGQRKFAIEATHEILEAAERWEKEGTFDRGASTSAGRSPRPKPLLRVMPSGSNDPRAERAG
jgi:predicted acylesterase/phospholipase RssA